MWMFEIFQSDVIGIHIYHGRKTRIVAFCSVPVGIPSRWQSQRSLDAAVSGHLIVHSS